MSFNADLSMHQNHRDVLEQIIERHLLTVTAEAPLREVIQLISAVPYAQCKLTAQGAGVCEDLTPTPFDRVVFVISEAKVQGIFTERDLVRLAPVIEATLEQPIGSIVERDFVALRLSEFKNFFTLVHLMRQHKLQYLPILDEVEQPIGLISLERIRQLLQPSDLLKFRPLKDVLEPTVVCAPPAASLQAIAHQMVESQVSCVVITERKTTPVGAAAANEPGEYLCPVGIITEYDIVQFQSLELDLEITPAAQVMSTPLISIGIEDSLWHVNKTMRRMRVRRLVVVHESGELAGIITLTQLLQILDPAEMFGIVDVLQQQVQDLLQQKEQLLQERASALEKEMESHLRTSLITQEKLRDSEKSYQTLVKNLPAGVYRLFSPPNNRMVFLNDYVERLTGFSKEDLQFGEICSIESLILDEDRSLVTSAVKKAIGQRQPFSLNYRITDKFGQIRYFWEQAQPIIGADETLSHYDGVIFDVTDREKAKRAFQLERDFNAAILETAGALVLVLDPQGHIVRFNSACATLTGYSIEELAHSPVWDTLIPPDEVESAQTVFQELLQGQYPNHHQNHWLDKNGEKHLISWSNTVLTDASGTITHVIATGIDKSETQQLEQQFLRVQRLESIGTLASGIAHDLNNILTPILAISQLLPLKIPDLDEESQHLLNMMKESAKRGSSLVSQVLSFSRGMEGDRTNLQLRHIISEIRSIAMQTFPKSIEISVDVPHDLWQVNGNPTQLHQVFMNLCVNARDAMKTGGKLSISAMNLQIDHQFTQQHIEAKVGQYILVTVTDTGIGISRANLDKIFEPFFTTKVPGKGTGLGLSTVHGIIKNHGGFITVNSELEKGSQFKIYLPAVASSRLDSEVSLDLPKGNGELILIVDDEAPIREITRDMLETYHYRVLTGVDGIEAIALYAQQSSEIEVILMDMEMPSMDGLTAIKTLQKLNPNVKLILTSGLASNERLALTLGDGIKAFIAKPFSSNTLLNTLYEVLSNDNSEQTIVDNNSLSADSE